MEGSGKGFRQLLAWQRADDLASLVFRAAEQFPPRLHWLASQMSRSAVSVPANIAEGYGRGSQGDYLRFLDIARGSLSELEYYIYFVSRENLISRDVCDQMEKTRVDTGRLLYGLWSSLKSKSTSTWDHTGRIREERELYSASD